MITPSGAGGKGDIMKLRSLIPAIGAATVGLAIAFAPAAGATSQVQQQLHLNGVPIDLGPALCVPGELFLTGNAHEHTQVNPNGDVWVNDTVEGVPTTVDQTTVLQTGSHGEAWFGMESNNGAQVMHFKASVFLPTGRIQMNGQFVVLPNGTPQVMNTTVTCG